MSVFLIYCLFCERLLPVNVKVGLTLVRWPYRTASVLVYGFLWASYCGVFLAFVLLDVLWRYAVWNCEYLERDAWAAIRVWTLSTHQCNTFCVKRLCRDNSKSTWEFDPGSERTLAAGLTHASRTNRVLRSTMVSGARVSNAWEHTLEYGITQGNLG